MNTATRIKLSHNAGLTCVTTSKFKRSVIRLALVTPLGSSDAAEASALFSVLRRGTARLPDMRAIGMELDRLYGARIEPITRKVGENLVTGFIADCIDERYAEAGLTEKLVALLSELFLNPVLSNGVFDMHYVAGEREALIDRIAAEKNDPRSYAVKRLIKHMCANEPYGKNYYGSEAQVKNVTPESIYAAYKRALSNAKLDIFYCGAAGPGEIEALFRNSPLNDYPLNNPYKPETKVLPEPEAAPKEITEEEAVTQGKLSLGFRTGGASIRSEDQIAYWVFQTVYGGSTSSKLFMEVREKKSLCYYASAQFVSMKGLLLVSSGIENKNFEIAKNEILKQLSACQNGGITDEELESARGTLKTGWLSAMDDPISIERYWQSQMLAGTFIPMEQRIRKLADVTKEQVVECAKKTKLDTVYFMKGVSK